MKWSILINATLIIFIYDLGIFLWFWGAKSEKPLRLEICFWVVPIDFLCFLMDLSEKKTRRIGEKNIKNSCEENKPRKRMANPVLSAGESSDDTRITSGRYICLWVASRWTSQKCGTVLIHSNSFISDRGQDSLCLLAGLRRRYFLFLFCVKSVFFYWDKNVKSVFFFWTKMSKAFFFFGYSDIYIYTSGQK